MRMIGLLLTTAILMGAAVAQTNNTARVTPEKYLMDRDAEIALARTAAPKPVSNDAEIMVLERSGYVTAVKGTNGFVCLVQRAWTAGVDDAGFWNPKTLGPGCFNAAAVHSYLQIDFAKASLVMAGAQTTDEIRVALEKKGVPAMEQGAMCYMLSKQQVLGDENEHWHPHLMFFLPFVDEKTWGAGLTGSTVFVGQDPHDKVSILLVPVGKWSDGTVDTSNQN